MTNQDPQKILTARFYTNKKRHQATRWQFDDLTLLKAIKDNATQLWNINRPDRKIIKLEDWRIS